MAVAFLDASALVKRYHSEPETAEVDRLFADESYQLTISRLGFIEVLSALAVKLRAGSLSPEGRAAARKRFLGDVKCRRLARRATFGVALSRGGAAH